jgi:hypothetical protein
VRIYINMGIAAELRDFLQGMADADLAGLGYSAADVTLIRDVSQDLNKLARIFRGAETLTNAKTFDVSFKRVCGICLVNGKMTY